MGLRRVGMLLGLAAMLSSAPAPAQRSAQALEQSIWKEYAAVERSVVCIRISAAYKSPTISPLTGEILTPLALEVSHGTGTVIDAEMVNGNKEYLILTNNHVATAKRVDKNRLLEQTALSIVENSDDENLAGFVSLEVLATDPDKDAALLRTKGAKRELPVFPHAFGLDGQEIGPGDVLITTGYPSGDKKITATGSISGKYTLTDVTPFPNTAYLANMPIDPGQSGSPVIAVTTKDGKPSLNLIGLIYAKGSGDTSRFITPFSGFSELVRTRKSVPSKRPSLDAAIPNEALQEIARGAQFYDVAEYRHHVKETPQGISIRQYSLEEGMQIDTEYLDIELGVGPEVCVKRVTGQRHAEQPISSASAAKYTRLFRALLNDMRHQAHYRKLLAIPNSDVNTTKMKQYYKQIIDENAAIIGSELGAFHSDMYREKVISSNFF